MSLSSNTTQQHLYFRSCKVSVQIFSPVSNFSFSPWKKRIAAALLLTANPITLVLVAFCRLTSHLVTDLVHPYFSLPLCSPSSLVTSRELSPFCCVLLRCQPAFSQVPLLIPPFMLCTPQHYPSPQFQQQSIMMISPLVSATALIPFQSP